MKRDARALECQKSSIFISGEFENTKEKLETTKLTNAKTLKHKINQLRIKPVTSNSEACVMLQNVKQINNKNKIIK